MKVEIIATYLESLWGKELHNFALDLPELKVMGIVAFIRQVGDIPAEDISIRYYISSKKLDAKTLLESSRSHWSIEVQLHWKLDVCMNEDACRIRRNEAGENFAAIRHIALNLLNADKSVKAGLKRKRTRACRNNTYLSIYLSGALMGQGAS